MIRIPKNRIPTHPGEILLEEFLIPLEMTQRHLADAIYVPYQRVNDIINGRRGITPDTALRLAKLFNTSADFWMNLQIHREMYSASKKNESVLEEITPLMH
ncbi:MAG: HigA family addiction module antitoxin [Flexilinea sp.]